MAVGWVRLVRMAMDECYAVLVNEHQVRHRAEIGFQIRDRRRSSLRPLRVKAMFSVRPTGSFAGSGGKGDFQCRSTVSVSDWLSLTGCRLP